MMSAKQVRVVRGAAAGAFATFISLLSHVTAGGQVSHPLGVLVPLLASMWVSVLLAGKRLSLIRLVFSVGLSQMIFHWMFGLGSALPVVATPATAGHAHHGFAPLELVPLESLPNSAEVLDADATMWLWHIVAAFVTIVVLYRGELLLTRLRTFATELAARLWQRITIVFPAITPVPHARAIAASSPRAHADQPELAPLYRRGPPRTQAF